MGIIVKVKTIAKPDYFICSWYGCIHNRDMECRRKEGPDVDEANGQCLSMPCAEGEEEHA